MNRQEIYNKIHHHLAEAREQLETAQKLADESGIAFHWEFKRDMSGCYVPKLSKELRELVKDKTWEEMKAMGLEYVSLEALEDENPDSDYDSWGDKKYGWLASARSC